jgi:hypothetical protein
MYGPTFSSLVFPTSNVNQKSVLSSASAILASASINDYYAGSWVALATLTLNGDLAKLKPLLRATSAPPAVNDPTLVPEGGSDGNESDHGGLSAGIIAGIVVGVVAAAIIVVAVGGYLARKKPVERV